MVKPPSRLFKYLPPARVDVLDRGLIAFSPPTAFNDPFELAPVIDTIVPPTLARTFAEAEGNEVVADHSFRSKVYEAVLASLRREYPQVDANALLPRARFEEVLKQVHSDAGPTLAANVLASYEAERLGPNFYRTVRTWIAGQVGVLSFASTHLSLLMWAHYADHHRGFVLGIDTSRPYFVEPGSFSTTLLPDLHPVTYSTQRPRGHLFDPSASEQENVTRLFKLTYLTKSAEWEYEGEWRLVRALYDAKEARTCETGVVPLFPFPRDAVTDVYVGVRADPRLHSRLAELVTRDALSGASLYHMQISDTRFELIATLVRSAVQPNKEMERPSRGA